MPLSTETFQQNSCFVASHQFVHFLRIAYVEFKSVASADKAIEIKDDYELDGRQLLISRASEVSKLTGRIMGHFVKADIPIGGISAGINSMCACI